jgi:hypothetical protein
LSHWYSAFLALGEISPSPSDLAETVPSVEHHREQTAIALGLCLGPAQAEARKPSARFSDGRRLHHVRHDILADLPPHLLPDPVEKR